MQLSANNKDYKIEFTFEAAESEYVQTAFEYFTGAYMFKGIKENTTELEQKVDQVDALMTGIAAVPKMAIDLLYMGLLEHHGPCGDLSQDINSRTDAKLLYKEFCKENPDSELAMHSNLFDALKAQIEEDGFFKRIGLEQMMEATSQPKKPQDHKKKSNA